MFEIPLSLGDMQTGHFVICILHNSHGHHACTWPWLLISQQQLHQHAQELLGHVLVWQDYQALLCETLLGRRNTLPGLCRRSWPCKVAEPAFMSGRTSANPVYGDIAEKGNLSMHAL